MAPMLRVFKGSTTASRGHQHAVLSSLRQGWVERGHSRTFTSSSQLHKQILSNREDDGDES
jgi:hypothetical protein